MPDIKVPYTPEGEELVENIKEDIENVGGEIDYAPGGTSDGAMRSVTEYAGGGKTGYGKIGMYKEGGKVERKEMIERVKNRLIERAEKEVLAEKLLEGGLEDVGQSITPTGEKKVIMSSKRDDGTKAYYTGESDLPHNQAAWQQANMKARTKFATNPADSTKYEDLPEHIQLHIEKKKSKKK